MDNPKKAYSIQGNFRKNTLKRLTMASSKNEAGQIMTSVKNEDLRGNLMTSSKNEALRGK